MRRNPQSECLSADSLGKANQALNRLIGCAFAEKRWHDLERAIVKSARELGEPDPTSLCQRIITNALEPGELEALADQLISGETSFFRDQETMQALQGHIIPSLIEDNRGTRKLTIWCAACSSGEEPLTIAMLLKDHKLLAKPWEVRIVGTDLRQRALDVARKGTYREWSFRGCPPEIRTAHFSRITPGEYQIDPAIHKQVEFAKLNLVLDTIPSALLPKESFDLILCRNVLIYLSEERVQEVLEKCHHCLRPGGWLMVAAAEAAAVPDALFESVQFQRVTFFRKPEGTLRSQVFVQPIVAQRKTRASPGPKNPSATNPVLKTRRELPAADLLREADVLVNQDLDAKRYREEAAASLELGNLVRARECLHRALFLDRQQPLGHFLKSQLHRQEGNPSAAAGSLRTARRLLEALPLDKLVDEGSELTGETMLNLIQQSKGDGQ